MHFKVDIPSADGARSLTVAATNWMSALRAALGPEVLSPTHPLFCDIAEDRSVRVAIPGVANLVILTPVSDEEEAGDTFVDFDTTPAASTFSEQATATVVSEEPNTDIYQPAVESLDDDLLKVILDELGWLHESPRSLDQVASRALDLAMRLIPSESGSVLFVGLRGHELYFSVARGPKAKEVLPLRVPLHRGVVGFCVREGVALALDEAAKDKRLYKPITKELSYTPRSILCAPIQHEGRVFGALELLNRNDEGPFTLSEVGLASHIAAQVAHYISLHL